MAAGKGKSGRGKGFRANVIVWTLLAALILTAGVLALNVSERLRRVVQETNQVRSVVQEAVRRQEMIIKAPARKEFSAAFLQMAFGDNPQLLEQIKASLGKALGANPTLAQGDVAMMLAIDGSSTCREAAPPGPPTGLPPRGMTMMSLSR